MIADILPKQCVDDLTLDVVAQSVAALPEDARIIVPSAATRVHRPMFEFAARVVNNLNIGDLFRAKEGDISFKVVDICRVFRALHDTRVAPVAPAPVYIISPLSLTNYARGGGAAHGGAGGSDDESTSHSLAAGLMVGGTKDVDLSLVQYRNSDDEDEGEGEGEDAPMSLADAEYIRTELEAVKAAALRRRQRNAAKSSSVRKHTSRRRK